MKPFIFSILLILISQISYSQIAMTTLFTKEGKETKNQSEAHYYREVNLSAGEQTSAILVQEKYISTNKTKLIGTYNNFKDKKFIGAKIEAYENGKVKSKEKFSDDGVLIDTAYYYYPSGKIKLAYDYPYKKENDKTIVSDTLILTYRDTIGNALLQDGNGYAEHESTNGTIEKGNYTNHKKEGEWSGSFSKGYSFEETYTKGKLISGTSTDSLGNTINYNNDNFMVQPDYPEGINALRRYIGNNYNYPKEAIQNNVKGTVRISFVISRDGSLENLTIDEDLGYGTGEEAIRVLKRAKKWSPGIMRGISVRVQYTIPVRLDMTTSNSSSTIQRNSQTQRRYYENF